MRSGDVLGRYELGEELGEGGMATVFRARDRELRRDVAVKVLFPHLARRAEIVKRFQREARAAAALEHPNILRIYDVSGGEADDPPYIVMELVRGRTLLEEIEQRGPMLAEVAACVGALLADALAAAHAALIVHRDVKPSNVLVAQGGRLLLADFGVARLETESSLVTKTGALLGTPAYMSPEQASGDTATAKSDIYSLGATLYQLATGHVPYSGSAAKVMAQLAAGSFVTPVRRRASVGPDLSKLIEQMMAVDPAARPASAAAIAAELRAFAAKGGFADPKDELAAYFAAPETYVAEKTPAIVTALLQTADRALAEDRLPRAMALADRASALAPNDPAVNAMIERVTEGGRASRRRKVLALAGAGVLVAGGATALGMTMLDDDAPVPPDAAPLVADAALVDAIADAMSADAMVTDAIEIDAAAIDARVIDARAPKTDARIAVVALDASVDAIEMTVPREAAIVVPDAAPPQKGTIVVINDTWCDVFVDGALVGQITGQGKFELTAGKHVVSCKQGGINEWKKEVEVVGGKSVEARGSMLHPVDVTLEIDAVIDGKRHARGTTAKLKPGRVNIEFDGKRQWFTIPRVACRLRIDAGQLVCDP